MDSSQVRGKEVPEEDGNGRSPGEQREKIREAVGCKKVPTPQQRHHCAQTPTEVQTGSRLEFPLLGYHVSPFSNLYQISVRDKAPNYIPAPSCPSASTALERRFRRDSLFCPDELDSLFSYFDTSSGPRSKCSSPNKTERKIYPETKCRPSFFLKSSN